MRGMASRRMRSHAQHGVSKDEEPCAAWRLEASRTAPLILERLVDGGLGLLLDLPQVGFAAKTLRVDLVDVFGAGRARGKPSALGNDLDAAERLTVSGSGGERGPHPRARPVRPPA